MTSVGRKGRSAGERSDSKADAAGPRAWAALAGLGALSALWSLFLWGQLVLSRSGGGAFCAFGGQLDCSSVWGSAFASAVHGLTGLPIAGWGVVWGATAMALPLAGLTRLAEGRSVAVLTTAVRLTAVAGILAVGVFLAESLAAGAICVGCVATYVLAGAYAGIALWGWRRAGFRDAVRSAALAGGSVAAAFLLLLYPGLHTPRSSGESGRAAIEAAATGASGPAPARTGTGNAMRDQALQDLVTALDPAQRQLLADSLAIYRNAPVLTLSPPRALVGSDLAPVRITEFTDILCEHCADLHETLRTLRTHAPAGSFAVDARQFPLDGRCNAVFVPGKGDDVRCVAAKARICVEPTGREPEFAAALFASQKGLTREKVLELAAPFLPKASLGACLEAPATATRLEEDIAAAARTDSDGTPIVLVNGRRGTSFGPFLYAMVLTKGNPEHPAFDSLPAGNPAAHLH